MTKYETKSIIMGRKKKLDPEDTKHPFFISLFDMNDPHKSGQAPKEIIDFELVDRVDIKGFDVSYLLGGNDIVVNDLEHIEVEINDNFRVFIKGKQSK
jgi:hypothetical protein